MTVKTEEKPKWLKIQNFKELFDKDLEEIITFFVFHAPCNNQSAMQKTLADYGWNAPWRLPYKLNSQLKQASTNFNLIFSANNYNNMEKALIKSDLYEKFPSDLKKERICIYDKMGNQFMSIFYHIRDAFAHGRFNIFDVDNEQVFVMEDQFRKKVSARMIIKKQTLLNWIYIIENGEKEFIKSIK